MCLKHLDQLLSCRSMCGFVTMQYLCPNLFVYYRINEGGRVRPEEMAQSLRALAILTQDMRSITGNHIVAHSHMYWDLVPSSVLQEYIQAEL